MVDDISHSAGGVVLSRDGRVLVVNQDGVSWSLPKGHVDPGETALQAAEREIYEESGVSQLTFIKGLGTYRRHRIGKGGIGEDKTLLKAITLFLYTTDEIEFNPIDPRHTEIRWVGPEKVASLLTHPKDKLFFEQKLPEIQKFIINL